MVCVWFVFVVVFFNLKIRFLFSVWQKKGSYKTDWIDVYVFEFESSVVIR